ncbi:UDP-N-acetylglucosamine--N-acetylmuramyl-(pentapeptide) pyrophosphoryl-undecaprenol N-acetylglucosamine transferase [Klebsiella aerogenes]|nr:UDP-N-acetylglucosamine--N-acetylmuramyl-(pentapeptide) pyrophosphoryl-undecaprenol N-acetylglucosamine transferase [Klebsiella aerogenes]
MVMAGGTGGHVFPGLAVAHHLMDQGWQVRWLGTADRMEADLVPKHGIDIDFIRISGLRGKGLKAQLLAPVRIFNAWRQARAIMKRFQPDVVLGMGGYVSGPGGLAAWSLGIPVVLHEQNGIAGLTNKWLAKIAKKVMQAFPGAFPHADVVGNPVRTDVLALPLPGQRLGGAAGADSRAGGWRLPRRARTEPDYAAGGREAWRCGDYLASEAGKAAWIPCARRTPPPVSRSIK